MISIIESRPVVSDERPGNDEFKTRETALPCGSTGSNGKSGFEMRAADR